MISQMEGGWGWEATNDPRAGKEEGRGTQKRPCGNLQNLNLVGP